MKVLAVICARAHSRGVPEKNIRNLLGKPVISYTMEMALAAASVTRIAVSTDEPRIEPICAEYGVEYISRPTALATDCARVDDALRHCCRYLQQQDGYKPDAVVLLYANVPIRPQGCIDRAVEMFMNTEADSVQTFAPVGRCHPYWLQKVDRVNGNRMSPFIENRIYRRQDLPELFAPDGCLYVMRYDVLMAAEGAEHPHAFLGQDRRGLVQESHETVDIDSLRDFFMAEAILRERASHHPIGSGDKTGKEVDHAGLSQLI